MAYFDNSNSTKVDERVIEAMLPYFRVYYGTAGLELSHSQDVAALTGLENARKILAKSIGADPREIVFTSGATESNNIAIRGVARANRGEGKHIITTKIETQSVLRSCERLKEAGYEITLLDVDEDGLISLTELEKSIRKDTTLVSIQHVNGEIGTNQQLKEIADITSNKGIALHSDATHSYMHIPIDVNEIPINILSFDAHHIHGPKGIGALYVRRKTIVHRLHEGGDEERRLRPGIENIPGAVGFSKAVEIWGPNENEYLLSLRKYMEKRIAETLTNYSLTGHPTERAPHIFSMIVGLIEGESMLVQLDMEGFCVSTGSACSSKTLQGSHVLKALGLPPERAHGSIRASFSRFNREEEIDAFVEVFVPAVERLREFSPLKDGMYFANTEEDNHQHDLPDEDW